MATTAQVETYFHSQINGDSPDKAAEAGDKWTTFPMSFFYSTEDSVDLAVKATMEYILEIDQAQLSDEQWNSLADDIDLKTVASDAIDTMATFSTAAKPS